LTKDEVHDWPDGDALSGMTQLRSHHREEFNHEGNMFCFLSLLLDPFRYVFRKQQAYLSIDLSRFHPSEFHFGFLPRKERG